MKKENADKLVEALRSGKYKQGKDYLKRGDKFCCLGVYCDIMGLEWKNEHKVSGIQENPGEVPKYHSLPSSLVSPGVHFRDSCGAVLDTQQPLVYGTAGEISSLAVMNDRGYSFEQIAVVIENRWEDL